MRKRKSLSTSGVAQGAYSYVRNFIHANAAYLSGLCNKEIMEWRGAGVVPFAVNQRGHIVLLLGKERCFTSGRACNTKWCDFSGGVEPKDTSIYDTAAREYHEELCGVRRMWDPRTVEELAADIKAGVGVAAELHREYAHESTSAVQYPTFLLHIPYDEQLPAKYSAHFAMLETLQHLRSAYLQALEQIPEVPLRAQLTVGACVPGICESCNATVVSIKEIKLCPTIIAVCNCGSAREIERPLDVPDGAANVPGVIQAYNKWQRHYHNVVACADSIRKIGLVNSPLIVDTTASASGTCYVTYTSVHPHYMEKMQLMWVGLPQLQDTVQNGGMFGTESVRGTFAPILSILLDFFFMLTDKPPNWTTVPTVEYVVDIRPWSMSSYALGGVTK